LISIRLAWWQKISTLQPILKINHAAANMVKGDTLVTLFLDRLGFFFFLEGGKTVWPAGDAVSWCPAQHSGNARAHIESWIALTVGGQ
jgi:hypothetical protein